MNRIVNCHRPFIHQRSWHYQVRALQCSAGNIIYKKLLNHGVDKAWIYSGGAIMPVVDHFYQNKDITYFINTHEQHAVHCATGYARASGKPGIALVTSGPGLTNVITPLLDAKNDSTPLIVISGQVSKSAMGTQAFQECPAVDLTKNVTKWSYAIQSIHEIPFTIDKAFKIATTGRKGSVHIDIPKCVATSSVDLDEQTDIYSMNNSVTESINCEKHIGNELKDEHKDTIQQMMSIVNNSERPVLYIGAGCINQSKILTKFAILGNIPVTTTLHAMGVFDEGLDLSLKMLGMHGSVASNYSMQNSDCIIAIGSRFDDRTTGNVKLFAPQAKYIFHININSKDLGTVITRSMNLCMDSGVFLHEAYKHVMYQERNEWMHMIKQWKQKYPFQYSIPGPVKIKGQCVLSCLNQYANKDDSIIYTTDVGNHQMYAAQYLTWRRPGQIITSGSLGVMGTGVPFAIGAQIANPNKTIICIVGDGGFNMSLTELQTIKRYKLPIKIMLINDKSLSMVKAWETLFFNGRHVATDNASNPNYADICKAYDIQHISCDNPMTLNSKMKTFLESKKPILAEFHTLSDLCLPLVKPGSALSDMMTYDTYKKGVSFGVHNVPS